MGPPETESFCKAKDTVIKSKRQLTDWENIISNPTLDKGLISKIYKDFKKLDSKTLINLIKQWGTEMYCEFSKYSITTLILSLAQPVIAWPPAVSEKQTSGSLFLIQL